jgi:ParB family transcriptional regulator, chromosome partitioning protein
MMSSVKKFQSPLAGLAHSDGLMATVSSQEDSITFVRVDRIKPNPNQPRRIFDEEALQDLTEDIRKHGILEPLMGRKEVDGSVTLAFGERRLRAAKALGFREVPMIVRAMTDTELESVAIAENLQRADLHPIEEILMLKRQIQVHGGQIPTARALNISRSNLAQKVRFSNFSDELNAILISIKRLKFHHLRQLAKYEAGSTEQLNAIEELRRQLESASENEPGQNPQRKKVTPHSEPVSNGRRITVKPPKGESGAKVAISLPETVNESQIADTLVKVLKVLFEQPEINKEDFLAVFRKSLKNL